jgi:hypothetical protein
MLSLFRDWPWPIILKVLSFGIACKTLYVFYSEPNAPSLPEPHSSQESLSSQPDSIEDGPLDGSEQNSIKDNSNQDNSIEDHSNQDNSIEDHSNQDNESELSSEYNVLNMKINILYLELIKIQPQLEKIQTTLDLLIKSHDSFKDTTHKHNEMGDSSNSIFMSQSVSEKDAELNFIETHTNQTHLETRTNTLVEQPIVNLLEQPTVNILEQPTVNILEQPTINLIEQPTDFQEKPIVNILEEPNENIQQQNKDELKEMSEPVERVDVEQKNETLLEQSSVETPKSDKTCSFILRSGQRKGQSCNSKVKGRHTYCGMHR